MPGEGVTRLVAEALHGNVQVNFRAGQETDLKVAVIYRHRGITAAGLYLLELMLAEAAGTDDDITSGAL